MRINLIPMAGEGQRFRDAGYMTPKPFLPIDGVPMVVRAASMLPAADRWIFIARKNHMEEYNGREILLNYFPGAEFVLLEHPTEGQACTCMTARELIPDDAALTIGTSDNGMRYSGEAWERLFRSPDVGGCIWTFRHNPAVLKKPEAYGWVETVPGGDRALRVSCKCALPGNPLENHAVIGSFSFRRAGDFFRGVETMIAHNHRIGKEFYADVAADYAIRNGCRLHVFEVDEYLCWGTPSDYETYLKGRA